MSHETPKFEQFSLCILQLNNCRNLDAKMPMRPDPAPMTTFRGQPLTHEVAEDMFIGWMAPQTPTPAGSGAAAVGKAAAAAATGAGAGAGAATGAGTTAMGTGVGTTGTVGTGADAGRAGAGAAAAGTGGLVAPGEMLPFSWLVAAGKNPAYDYFPCQHQVSTMPITYCLCWLLSAGSTGSTGSVYQL